MHCIACGREGHYSARCPLQLWKREAPAAPAAAIPASKAQPLPRHIDSHDRAREAWLQFA